jgi:glycerol-3-phosphate dehydrogenase (NAD(P)+)
VVQWARNPEFAQTLQEERCNQVYLPDEEFPDTLTVTSRMQDVASIRRVLVVVPSHGFRKVVRRFLEVVPAQRSTVLISGTKGIETDHLARMSQVSFEEGVSADREVHFAALAGPSFAAELAAGMPTAAVVASTAADLGAELREVLSSPTFRLYSTTDVVGTELGGASKNVIAIAAGVVSGLGLGHNTLAALLTRGLHEITRLGIASGGKSRTLSGLAGMGDLVLTCTGGLSRNRQLGLQLAQGKSLAEISAATSMVAEGVRNSKAVAQIAASRGVEMPITEQMVDILYNGKSPRLAVESLMTRDLREEAEL